MRRCFTNELLSVLFCCCCCSAFLYCFANQPQCALEKSCWPTSCCHSCVYSLMIACLPLAACYAFVLLAVVVVATVQFKFAAIARKLCYNYSCCCCCYFFIFAVATDTVEPPRWGMRQIIKMSCCRRLPANASQRQQK